MASPRVREPQWKCIITNRLKTRNKRQCESYVSLVQAHNKLVETVDVMKSKNVHLSVEVEKLKQDNLELAIKVESGGGGGKGERTQALEQKLFKLQEELTETHKKKGENAQQIIELNNALQEKDKELQARDTRISELESSITTLEEENKTLAASVSELETVNQMLTDEQQALQLAFTSLEVKFRKLFQDNNELVTRWMALKAKDADRLNEENDKAISVRQAKMKKELAEAAKEPKVIKDINYDIPYIPEAGICIAVSVPSRALFECDGHEGEVNAIKWSPSGRIFATGGADRKLKLWEARNGKCESKGILAGSNAAIMSIEFDLEETSVLAASNDFASRVWTLSDQRLRHTLTGHSGKVLAARFLGDPWKVVTGSHDRTLKLWDLRSKACTKTVFAGSSCNDLVTVDGLGTNIISGHFDRKIRFWDTRADSSVNEIHVQGRVTSLDLSPDRLSLLACARDDTISIIDLRMNQVTDSLSADGFHVGCDWTRAFYSPDGEYVMAGSQNGSLFVWNLFKHSLEKTLKEHTHSVVSCSWHPNGSMLLSCDKQRKIILWSDF